MRALGRALPLVVVLALATACNGWLSFRGDPGLSGFNPNESVLTPANIASLQEVFATAPATGGLEGGPVVANGVVYVTSTAGELLAYDARGSANCSGSPVRCVPLWRAGLPAYSAAAPTISGDLVYVVSGSTDAPGTLQAFRAGTGASCALDGSGPTRTCAPVWQANVTSPFAAPTVADGVLYTIDLSTGSTRLVAFDAAGVNGCGGQPVVCSPLWATADGSTHVAPAVANGLVYQPQTSGVVHAYDARGERGCSGSPKTCAPLWSTTPPPPMDNEPFAAPVVGGFLVMRASRSLQVFDALGSTGCAGTPVVCQPLWSATVGQQGLLVFDAVAHGNVYVMADSQIAVYDLAGVNGCGGSPRTCSPLRFIRWGTRPPGNIGGNDAVARSSSLTIAGDVGLVGLGGQGSTDWRLVAFDATSTTACTGVPLTCPILWARSLGTWVDSTPAVLDGRVYVGTRDGVLHVFAPSG